MKMEQKVVNLHRRMWRAGQAVTCHVHMGFRDALIVSSERGGVFVAEIFQNIDGACVFCFLRISLASLFMLSCTRTHPPLTEEPACVVKFTTQTQKQEVILSPSKPKPYECRKRLLPLPCSPPGMSIPDPGSTYALRRQCS